MNFKKITTLLLILVLVFSSLTACGKKPKIKAIKTISFEYIKNDNNDNNENMSENIVPIMTNINEQKLEEIKKEEERIAEENARKKAELENSKKPQKVIATVTKPQDNNQNKVTVSSETRAVWISYLEFDKILRNKSEASFTKSIQKYFDECVSYGLNTLIVQVRSHGDAIYKSKYFPSSVHFTDTRKDTVPFDALNIMINEAHKRGLKFEAWVNPYRCNKVEEPFSDNDFVKNLVSTDSLFLINGIYYLNPAEPTNIERVINGIAEILDNYNVDGIHFDDYFYPSGINNMDENTYKKYGENMSLNDFRTSNVTKLVASVYQLAHSHNVTFGISPQGNMNNCRNKCYLDIDKFTSTEGYIDYIAPQLYWGYDEGTLPYQTALSNWCKIMTNPNIKLLIGLAPYKIGRNSYWNNGDILSRQVIDARLNANYKGFILFRFDFFFGDKFNFTDPAFNKDKLIPERDNLKKILT